jgi:hypothetical protein
MQATIRKGGSYKGSRLVVKAFKSEELAHEFMNKQSNNDWIPNSFADYMGFIPSTKDLKAGTYAYAGGQYHNVKSLDASVLAHI